MKLHHIGIATPSIPESIEKLKETAEVGSIGDIVFDPEQNAELCMIEIKDGTDIELVSGEVVSGLVKKGQRLYHLCWETDDIEAQIKSMVKEGGLIVSPLKPAVQFDRRRVAFVMTSLGLTELVEAE